MSKSLNESEKAVWFQIVCHAKSYDYLDFDEDDGPLKLTLETYLNNRFGDGNWSGELCWFSSVGRAELAEKTGFDERTIQRCVKRMTDVHGLIEVAFKGCSGKSGPGSGRVRCFALEPLNDEPP